MTFTYDKVNSAVLADGELLGTLAENVLTHIAEIAPAHKGQIRAMLADEGIEGKVSFKLDGGEAEEEQEEESQDAPIGNGVPPPAEVPIADSAPTAIPPCPPMDHRYGDKTPAVVAWYREHKPDEYATKYAGRKVGGVFVKQQIAL